MISTASLIAVDIGNARIKLGLFSASCEKRVPVPAKTLAFDGNSPDFHEITAWLGDPCAEPLAWWIASVNRPATTHLIEWLRDHRPDDPIVLLSADALPLEVRLERPDMVGIDRLVDAVAVNRLRDPDRSAVIVDVGSAITVDLVSSDGAFLGGAILPGVRMSARALHEFTDLLPLIDVADLATAPSALGTDTVSAMQSGLFWGTVGAVRQLIDRLTCDQAADVQVFLTGGAGPIVAELLGPNVLHNQDLTLIGVAISTASRTLRS